LLKVNSAKVELSQHRVFTVLDKSLSDVLASLASECWVSFKAKFTDVLISAFSQYFRNGEDGQITDTVVIKLE